MCDNGPAVQVEDLLSVVEERLFARLYRAKAPRQRPTAKPLAPLREAVESRSHTSATRAFKVFHGRIQDFLARSDLTRKCEVRLGAPEGEVYRWALTDIASKAHQEERPSAGWRSSQSATSDAISCHPGSPTSQ